MFTKDVSLLLSLGLAILVLFSAGCGGGAEESATPAAQAPAQNPRTTEPSSASGTLAQGGSSSVTGTIVYEGAVPKLRAIKMDADPGCAKKHSGQVPSEALALGEGNTIGNVFVHVKSGLPAGSWPMPAEAATLNQNGCQYKPHVLGMMVGQPLKILNSDELLHNVHALPRVNSPFNRAMPATVTEFNHVFEKEELMFKIKCDVHPWMGAYISVLSHPFFDVTAVDGKFTIANLPAGNYEIEAWHEKLGQQTISVTVADGDSTSADFTFRKG